MMIAYLLWTFRLFGVPVEGQDGRNVRVRNVADNGGIQEGESELYQVVIGGLFGVTLVMLLSICYGRNMK